MQALEINSIHDTEEIDSDQLCETLDFDVIFELGGDSLASIRAISSAQARVLPLALEQFFRSFREIARSAATLMANVREWTSQTLFPLNWLSTKACSLLPTRFLLYDANGTVWQSLELGRQLPFAVVIQALDPLFGDDTESIPEAQSSSVEGSGQIVLDQIRER